MVERPASVVKELLENSLDAKAKHIQIDIEYGGVRLLRVRDDGEGMQRDDLLLATKSHTTSKIYTTKDLQAIGTLGFRGEALASIASISHLQIQSCAQDETQAWKIFCSREHEGLISIEPTSHPQGTTVEVRDLFYNIPARRKFLRSDKTEFGHIEALVKNLALSHFEVGFELQHNQRLIFQLKPAYSIEEKQKRIEKLVEKQFLQQAITIDFSAVGLRLHGWLGLPSFERSQNDWQFFYVNGRVVRDRILNHAVKQAYQDQLYPGKHPSYILHLETELDALDVNVHPTKHEVRFHDQRLIHDFIFRHLFAALNNEKLAEASAASAVKPLNIIQFSVKEPSTYYQMSSIPHYEHKVIQPHSVKSKQNLGTFITRINEKVILARNAIGLAFIHIEKAQYALAYSQLKQAILHGNIKQQPLLIPAAIQLPENDLDYLSQHQSTLIQLGINITQSSANTVLIRSLPAILKKVDLDKLFHDIVNAQLPLDEIPINEAALHHFVHILADNIAKSSVYSESTSEVEKFLIDCVHIEDEHAKKYLKAAINTITLEQIEKMHV